MIDTLIAFKAEFTWVFWIGATALGLIVGSFINVVIHRLPIMMMQGWKSECAALLEAPEHAPADEAPYNLVKPRSRCPGCGRMIKAWENIPLISYLLLRARCPGCGMRISLRYPAVELLVATLTVGILLSSGISLFSLTLLPLVWGLVAMSFIDLEHQLLPDQLTLPLLWLGLLVSLHPSAPLAPEQAIMGAAVGYLSLWSVYHLFRLLTGKEGMGYGDFKLMGLLGAWMGWTVIPLVVLLGSALGLLGALVMMLAGQKVQGRPMPFGPFLAGAGLIGLFWGDPIIEHYLRLSGY
ncbi:leader peptidase (prepilin peptidase)/N-methyltransferase [Natronospira proteinivora]|uniref:Prepilin leader peptidase/N-methyltransferase n=1 Tax=Natronospira proteinivora TaxID=1807133 RepID=A0ABT1G4A5_9GAMM|nr:A24 family peptidase [Natronospira proteinivora]MCP1726120.1 leader peptidase (prepilin peptidase)/N-methyltransferase [Natronospira proteinivora]